jgi:hypothetical protein
LPTETAQKVEIKEVYSRSRETGTATDGNKQVVFQGQQIGIRKQPEIKQGQKQT